MSHKLDSMQAQRVVAGHSVTTLAKKAKETGMVIEDKYQDIEKSPLTYDTSKGWVFNIEIP